MPGKIMLVGLGGVAKAALQLMVTKPEIKTIVVASRNGQQGEAFCNLVAAGALAQGFQPQIDTVSVDLNQPERTAEIISLENPDVIFSTATLMSPWLTGRLPLEVNLALYPAGFGVWLPMHLPLTMKLMRAVRLAGYRGITLTAPFPDIVNCMLAGMNLSPTSGIGNVDLYIPKVKRLAAEALGVSTADIEVKLVAHHALMPYFMGLATDHHPPFHLAVKYRGADVTREIDARKLLATHLPAIVGPETNYVTASSAVRLIQAFLSEKDTETHAPSPNGLPGGYPVTVNSHGIKLSLVEGVTTEQAIQINEDSQPFDGIQRIKPDGTAVFTDAAVQALTASFHFTCNELHPDESPALAEELLAKVRERMQIGNQER
ncbi:MAG: hypothetical protein ACOZF0_10510 [Thermodesulfobacteriota bacterium]